MYCKNHTQTRAAGICSKCKQPICRECLDLSNCSLLRDSLLKGIHYCIDCLDQKIK